MNKTLQCLCAFLILFYSHIAFCTPSTVELSVWANEAIIAIFTYDYKDYSQAEKKIANYFRADAWISYSKLWNDILNVVKANSYTVSAVATKPPQIIVLDPTHWQAIMPVLVLYQSTEKSQQQNLNVIINFVESVEGVRGLSITSIQTKEISPPCECKS